MSGLGWPRRRSSLLLRRGSAAAGSMDSSRDLEADYDRIAELGRGRFGRRVLLVEEKATHARLVLRVFAKAAVPRTDFLREHNYSLFLAPHPNVVETYEGALSGPLDWWFVQEAAPRGSVRDLLESCGGPLPEHIVKTLLEQTMSGLEFLHGEGLVHRDLCAENLLLFPAAADAALRLKLADFHLTRKAGARTTHSLDALSPYHAPELVEVVAKEAYTVEAGVDVWALGVLVFLLGRARFPWPRAAITSKAFLDWKEWRKGNTHAPPKLFQRFTDRGLKMMKKAMCLKSKDRPPIKDLKKYLKDRWFKEIKQSASDEDLRGSKTRRASRLTKSSPTSPTVEEPNTDSKRKSILHQWFATTLNTMSEISEQMVSAED